MKRILVMLALMFCTLGAVAQTHTPGTTWSDSQVTLTATTVGNGANFVANTHAIGQDICIDFTLDPSSYNVAGDFAGRYTIHAVSGSQDVYIGRYAQQNSSQAWHVYVTFHWTAGACN
jgi:hypothetical protein